MSRGSLLTTAEDLVADLKPGAVIGFGGLMNHSHAMPVVRELVRRGIGDLHAVGPACGMEVDMLIAAGLVRRVSTAAVSAESMGMTGPAFRRQAQAGLLEVRESDEGLIYAGLQAAAQGVEFAPYGGMAGTSLAELNPGVREIESPFTKRSVQVVRAIPLDLALIHAAAADPFGNVQFVGGGYGDRALARAARKTACTVERIVDNEDIRRRPELTALAGVDHVIHAPFGSHPFSSPGFYIHDAPMIAEYVRVATEWLRTGERATLDDFFLKWIHQPKDHWDYLDRLGSRRLNALSEGLPGAGTSP